MKSPVILCVSWILLVTTVALPQFFVTSSVPSDGAVDVPLSTTVSFSFNAPLDTLMHFGDRQFPLSLIASDPLDSMVLGAVTHSPDLRMISIEVTHTANTDFVWLITGARDNAGKLLSQPYVLNYTTSSTHGTNSVSGIVSLEGGDAINSIVALLSAPIFSEEEGVALIGAVVKESSGEYTANYVRDGIYWPVAAKDMGDDGEIDPTGEDVVGFYDPNDDGQPDSIVVSGNDLTGIDMALFRLFVPVTARAYVDTATSMAEQFAPDPELRGIGVHADPKGIDIELDGSALMWVYQFYSTTLRLPILVIVSSIFTWADTTVSGLPSTGLTIPENFIDSDVAMALANANGGHDFETQRQLVRRTLYGGNMWAGPFLQDTTKIIWVAEYEAIEPDSSISILRVFVDMVTGELVTEVEGPHNSIPLSYSLSQNYPNPFNPQTRISYQIAENDRVTLVVYNLAGQKVRELVDRFQTGGRYEVIWDGRDALGRPASSGVYLYRLQAGPHALAKKMLLLR